MAHRNTLSDSQLSSAERLLSGLVKDKEKLNKELQKLRSLHQAIIRLGSDSATDPSSQQRIDLISTLDEAASGDFELGGLFWNDGEIHSIQDAARRYSRLLSTEGAEALRFRMRLFALEPTAVICSVIEEDAIIVEPADAKSLVLQVFQYALSKNFDIARDSIEAILQAPDLSEIDLASISSFLRNIQRLQALVRVPEDIQPLLHSSFLSAHQVAQTPRKSFVAAVSRAGMSEATAVAVHDHALTIEIRNEQAWTALLASKSQTILAAAIPDHTTAEPKTKLKSPSFSSQTANYSNLFGESFETSCDDSMAVTGPVAYFVDLLRVLKNTPSRFPEIDPRPPSLLHKLFQRRPDLQDLELTSSNANSLVPYIDLAIEAMESFIKNLHNASSETLAKTGLIEAFNTTDEDTENRRLSQAKQAYESIYREQIASQVFPLSIFPYNYNADVINSYFHAFGFSHHEVLKIFGSRYTLCGDHFSSENLELCDDVLQAALAASYLNLLHEDIIAITSTAIFPIQWFDKVKGEPMDDKQYRKRIGALSVGEYWGYPSSDNDIADHAMLSETVGLTLVEEELLPRASVTMAELIDILKTRFFNGRLALTNADGSAVFSGKVKDLRLRHPSKDNPRGLLTVEDCHALQSFIRLWRKSKWSLDELDFALSVFGNRLSPDSAPRIDIQTIIAIAAVQQISQLVGVQISRLLPLWSILDTAGEQSIYRSMFLRVVKPTPVFGSDGNGGMFETEAKISETLPALSAALGLPSGSLGALVEATGVLDDALNPGSLSALYRSSLFCSMMELDPIHYGELLKMLGNGISPFKDPQTTLRIISQWRRLKSAGIDLAQLKRISGIGSVAPISPDATICDAAKATFALLKDLDSVEQLVPETRDSSAEEVRRIASMLFDPSTAKRVVAFVEDPVPSKDSPERRSFYQAVLQKYFVGETAQLQAEGLYLEYEATSYTEKAELKWLVLRRTAFLYYVRPALKSRMILERANATLATLIPSMEFPLLDVLLRDVVRAGPEKRNPVAVFAGLAKSNTAVLENGSSDCFFAPPSTDVYRIIAPAEMPTGTGQGTRVAPSILIDGVALSRDWEQGRISNELHLSYGQVYRLQGNGLNIAACSYLTTRGEPRPLKRYIVSNVTVESVRLILDAILRASAAIDAFKLTLEEVSYLQGQQVDSDHSIGFSELCLGSLDYLARYSLLRARLGGAQKLLAFSKWTKAHLPEDDLACALSSLTNFPQPQIQKYLDSRYADMPREQVERLFNGTGEIVSMLECESFVSRIGAGFNTELLTKWSTPRPPPLTKVDDGIDHQVCVLAQSLSNGKTQPRGPLDEAENRVRTNKRDVLVSYLLQQQFIKDQGIFDADGLFEYLLIDVQMGSCLQTSRIKQAISIVQLYVQRCILGLEKDHGVDSGTVDLERWSWMEKYTLWEANRKIFLYPEDWLDPTLRDDKTEQFKELEASLLQNDLSNDSLVDRVKGYIYAADRVADLDVQSYLWDKKDDAVFAFHFFARTRSSPYEYFYRTMEMVRDPGSEAFKAFWQPWSKINVDIPVLEADEDGKPLAQPGAYLVPAIHGRRLLLFLPQLTLQTMQSSASHNDTTFEDIIRKGKSNELRAERYWEVHMGWIEYRNGHWSPTQWSQASLSARTIQPSSDQSPSLAVKFLGPGAFRFWIRSRQSGDKSNILCIDVERVVYSESASGHAYHNQPLGTFEMRKSHLVLADNDVVGENFRREGFTDETVFSKISYTMTNDRRPRIQVNLAHDIPHFGSPAYNPLYCIAPIDATTTKGDIKWTMSLDTPQPSGLILDVNTSDKTMSYFAYPFPGSSWTFVSENFQNVLSPSLIEIAAADKGLQEIFACIESVPNNSMPIVFGKRGDATVHELSTPYAIYNWELGIHVIMLLVERLQSTGQYDLALRTARFIFDPTIEGRDGCWRFPPFKDLARGNVDTVSDILGKLGPSSGSEFGMRRDILEWRKSPFNAHVVARGRPLAYMKRIVMRYVEILIASGDEYFRKNTLESIPLAIQRYVEASHVFGPTPQKLPRLGKAQPKTYAQLDATLNDFSNAAFDMELDFPFFSDPAARGARIGASDTFSMTGILKTTYFCVPPNPRLTELRNLIHDRLYKIRNCQNINGISQSLALWEPSIDPGLLVRAAAKGITPTELLNDTVGPMPNYRFVYLLHKAFEMASELKSLNAIFLSVREKRDAEAVQNLRVRQDRVLQSFTAELRELAKQETEKQIAALEETRKGQVSRLQYYLALAGETGKDVPGENGEWEEVIQEIEQPTTDELRMTSNEKLEMEMASKAAMLNLKASFVDLGITITRVLPDRYYNFMPVGVGVTVGSPIKSLFEALAIAASVMRQKAQMCADDGFKASRKASLIRQLQDRRMQANAAGREIKTTDKHIEASRLRLQICERDIKLQKQQAKHIAEMEEWLKTKYTNEQLYAWMDGNVRSLFYQTFLLANDIAKKAQKAFRFERGDPSIELIQQGYWDSGRDGLLSGEYLYLSLKKLEAAYLEKRNYDFEITKNVSLREIDPWALIQLREEGEARFSIPEVVFDLDFPGQYCRRIKSVSLFIPCVVGPYTGVNATLTLVSHKYRISSAPTTTNSESKEGEAFRTDQIPISAIAVSQGQQDNGAFTLDFRDERYIPFEGAGAISTWHIQLPPSELAQFDYDTISDVVLHIRYTSLNGDAKFRDTAMTNIRNYMGCAQAVSEDAAGGLVAVLDLKNDFPNKWYQLQRTDRTQPASMRLDGLRSRLPFFTRGKTVIAKSVSLLVKAAEHAEISVAEDIQISSGEEEMALKTVGSIGGFQMGMAEGVDAKIGDWALTVSTAALQARLERVLVLVRYAITIPPIPSRLEDAHV